MGSVRVLVVDDRTLFRRGLIGLLGSEPGIEVVGEAETQRAEERALELLPDIILTDVAAGLDAAQITHRFKDLLPDVRVVMLRASDDERDLFLAVKGERGVRG